MAATAVSGSTRPMRVAGALYSRSPDAIPDRWAATDRIEKAAAELGVELDLIERFSDLWLGYIEREERGGKRGSGAAVVRMVLAYADEVKKPVRLEVIDGKRLVRYYRRLGFMVECKTECRWGHPDVYMVRYPVCP